MKNDEPIYIDNIINNLPSHLRNKPKPFSLISIQRWRIIFAMLYMGGLIIALNYTILDNNQLPFFENIIFYITFLLVSFAIIYMIIWVLGDIAVLIIPIKLYKNKIEIPSRHGLRIIKIYLSNISRVQRIEVLNERSIGLELKFKNGRTEIIGTGKNPITMLDIFNILRETWPGIIESNVKLYEGGRIIEVPEIQWENWSTIEYSHGVHPTER
jgi:hypothetical protein